MNYVKTFLDRMQEVNKNNLVNQFENDARKELELTIFRETSTPITERLKRLIASIPEEEINTPRSLEWFRTRLRGVEGRGAHSGQVGEALRALNYERKRAWSNSENGFRSKWKPK